MIFSKKLLLLPLLLASQLSPAQSKSTKAVQRPKLMIGLVVDQMRWDYLYRYYDRYSDGGFKRMLSEGFSCDNNMIDYIPTKTAIGHATIYTGTTPAFHGIAGNDFIIQSTGKSMYCTEDAAATPVGSTSDAGRMSPRNLLTTTIGDELKLATNSRAKVIGIALKDRGAILPAGHAANAAYWFDDLTGSWISSNYYMTELPAWLTKFNANKQAEKYLKQNWNTLYPVKTYLQSTADENAYEKKFNGAANTSFPIQTAELFKSNGFGLIRSTPFGNTITFDLAKAAITNEDLGRDEITDLLTVSLSSTDYVGHQFGVNAVETEDTYLRLDLDLANFFKFLDKTVGEGNYSVFLSADHGGAHNSAFLRDQKLPSNNWNNGSQLKAANAMLEKRYGLASLLLSLSNNQVHLNYNLIEANGVNVEALKKDAIAFFKKQDGIAWAVDVNHLSDSPMPEFLKERIRRGYHAERSGDLFLVLKANTRAGLSQTGTDHGVWNPYDSHIPLVWMGWGINKGRTVRETNMTDIAATVSALLHIQMPSGSIGHPIEEAIK